MTQPIWRCPQCGDTEIVKMDGRGFPPAIAERRLAKRCKTKGHVAQPVYRAGIGPDLQALLDQIEGSPRG